MVAVPGYRPLRTVRQTLQYMAAFCPYRRIIWLQPVHSPSSHGGQPSAAEAAARSTGVIHVRSLEHWAGRRGREKPPAG